MTELYTAGPFLGINNKLATDKLLVPKEGAFVRDAVNVDLTSSGLFKRRDGVRKMARGINCRSLWSAGANFYYADADQLYRFDGTYFHFVAQLGSTSALVSFCSTPRGIVWTDGITLQLINDGVSKPLSVPAPNPEPQPTVLPTSGSLGAGQYVIAFANVDADGVRSVLSAYYELAVSEFGAINIDFAASAYATQVFVGFNGSQLYRELTVPAGATNARISLISAQGAPVSDVYEAPMPPGVYVRYYRGRLLTVSGNAVFYSNSFALGTYRPASNYVLLDDTVTLCEPTDDGVYLATASKTWSATGMDFAEAPLTPIAAFGAIPNTATPEPNSLNMWWSTPRGAVRTTEGNTLELHQDANIAFGNASNGAAMFREAGGLTQFVAVLSNVAPSGAASASSFMDAEVIYPY